MDKLFSRLVVKELDEDKRTIRGIASTPSTDRMGDIVRPEGAKFSLPIPLLWQHNHDQPIGQVVAAKVTEKGIEIEAQLAKVDAPSQLSARLEESWQSIKAGLVRGLSIGFRPIKYSFLEDSDGVEYIEWDFYELSAVTIPANVDASITNIKQFSQPAKLSDNAAKSPALGQKSVKLHNPKKVNKMNYQEMIKRLEATKAEKLEARDAIQKSVSNEGRTKDAAEREQFDTLNDEIKSLDLELKDLRDLEAQNVKTAKPVADETPEKAKDFSGIAIHKAPEKLEKGIAFARFAGALGAARGDLGAAMAVAEKRFPDDKRLHHIMKSAVAAGTTQNAAWAGNLVEYQEIATDFIEYLRPKTIIGQFGVNGVPALRSIPFNVTIKGQSAGGSAGWVGEGKHKPLTNPQFSTVNLGWFKLAAITVASDELLRFSNPSAERLIRDDLAAAVIEEMDSAFIALSNAGTSNVKPASITNSLTSYTSGTGDPEADIAALWTSAVSGNYDLSSAVYITTPAVAMKLAGLKSAADNRRFPEVTVLGGKINGIPLIVSNKVDANAFILAFASEIFIADDNIVTLDASREAALIMDSAPQSIYDAAKGETPNAAAAAAAVPVSMFQTNQIAFRAERYVNWAKRRTNAVAGVDTSKNSGWK
jgi:HK97 family phage major capsid protein/HK97 family phage prohead protease